MATRHQVRRAVISLLYASEMGSEMREFCAEFLEEKKIRNAQREYAMALFEGVKEHIDEIDFMLDSKLSGYKLSQIGAVQRAILRLGVYEIKFSDTDLAVIINEAIELAKEMCSESAPKFINGVLDSFTNS